MGEGLFSRRNRAGEPLGSIWPGVIAIFAVTLAVSGSRLMRGSVLQEPAQEAEYLGRETCGTCHEDRARQHASSNFLASWRPVGFLSELQFERSVTEAGVAYRIERQSQDWVMKVKLPHRPEQVFPIHSVVGGERFGFSLLLQVEEVESRRLPRRTLVEARYFIEAGSGKLKLSPGFSPEPPSNYETALGRVLSPEFEEKCLNCHGGISDPELARQGGPRPIFVDAGVGCERCHGPGSRHLEAFEEGGDDLQIINPAKLSHPEVMELCGQCHTGFFPMSRPRPQDLLISNQVNALARTQCYIQSGEGFSCVSCHDPHSNARTDDPVYNQTCRQCHTGPEARAVNCGFQPEGDCVQCHMPVVDKPGNFHLRDHWIRVIPGS